MIRRTVVRWHGPGPAKPASGAGALAHARYYGHMGWEALRHLYHGFRLFGANTRLAWRYSRRLRAGVALTRRERMLLERATVDLLRLVPFSFFVIVPFAELLLPIALKMFPGLIPSTFETENQGRNQAFQSAMATMRARQRLTDYMTTTLLARNALHADVLRRAASGDALSVKQIKSVAFDFRRDGPLSVHRLPSHIVAALARTLGVYPWWARFVPQSFAAPRVRTQILRHYRKVKEDDQALDAEGMSDLTREELIKANQQRGMRWTESTDTLLLQLEWWVQLAKDPKVPYNTLWWIKPTRYSLRQSMADLPLEERRKLLGIHNLPPNVRDSLAKLCDNVVGGKQAREVLDDTAADADTLARKVESIATDADSAASLASECPRDVRVALAAAVTGEEEAKLIFAKLRAARPAAKASAPATVSELIETLANRLHHSTHVVSTVFDALEYQSGSQVITEQELIAVAARCRESIAAPATTAEGGSAAKADATADATKR